MKYTSILCLCLLLGGHIWGQDKHFSQFYAAPLTMNPALTGAFDGSFRVGGIYRDQWRGALDNPLVTFSAFVDLRFELGRRGMSNDAVGGGIVFFTDRVGGLDFNTNQMALSGAYHKSLDREATQFLSAGLKLGFTQRNTNYAQLTFEDQFNGSTGYDLGTGEALPANNFSYADMAFGLYYTISPERDKGIYAGLALHHFNRPNISFYEGEEEGGEPIATQDLFMKTVMHLGGRLPLSDEIQFSPRLVGSMQGPHIELTGGANIRYAVNDYSSYALHFGIWARPVRFEQGFEMDAIIGMVGLEYENILFGLSYDSNINSLSSYSKMHGAFEISVVYAGNYENETILCPTF